MQGCNVFLLSVVSLLLTSVAALADVQVGNLRCEYRAAPAGIDVAQPRLSWIFRSADCGQRQTAYRLLAASSPEKLAGDQGDLWDTGEVASDRSIQVAYAGTALKSGMSVCWKVRIWDKDGKPSAWSRPATWTMGLLKETDWHGKWIGLDGTSPAPGGDAGGRLPARMLRREFEVGKQVNRATLYVCGLGYHEVYLNGKKVGDDVLDPALSEYEKRVYYVTHDVTEQLRQGGNAIGVVLGNSRFFAPRSKAFVGMRTFGYPKLLLQLNVEYADGSRMEVVSDEHWKLTADGPILANNDYDGEEYDARKEMPGWSCAGFDGTSWQAARPVAAPGGKLAAQVMPAMRVTETIEPAAIRELKPGVYIVNMGQNMVGWCRLTVQGPKGTAVTLRHAETLQPNGNLYVANLRTARATDVYTLRGEGIEVYEPRFTYHGFRYVEVRGFPGKPTLAAIRGRVVHTALRPAGSFSCSNPLVNQIHGAIRWGVRGNYLSVPTDCPQRDERQGWQGDRAAESRGETYLFQGAPLYEKWMNDIQDTQRPDGNLCDVAPAYWPFYNPNVTWPSAYVVIPGTLYRQYADRRVLESHYASQKKWMDYHAQFIRDGITAKDSYGDWCVPPEKPNLVHSNDPARRTPGDLLATAYYVYDLRLMAGYAAILGRSDEARQLSVRADAMARAFQKKFFNAAAGQYGNGSQTSQVLPLAFGIVPPDLRQKVFAGLVENITVQRTGHMGTGLIGGQWLMGVLSDNGRPDLAYRLASNKDYPSWGYMIGRGATTIWELWNGDTGDPAMNSGNHVMLVGDLTTWLYEYLAGIQSDPGQPGFKHVLMRPRPVGDLTFVKASHDSPYGTIRSAWEKAGVTFRWSITLPPNTTATIYVPTREPRSVRETGGSGEGVARLADEPHAVVFRVGSGSFVFEAKAE